MPAANSKSFLLLDELGHGSYGDAYLACGTSGRICVVKRYIEPDPAGDSEAPSPAQKEAQIWNRILTKAGRAKVGQQKNHFPSHAFVGNCNGKHFLVMPWLQSHLEKPEGDDSQKRIEATREIIHHMACAGYRHDDLHWRHVGFYSYGQDLFAMLFDFGICSQLRDDQSRQEAEDFMLNELGLDPN